MVKQLKQKKAKVPAVEQAKEKKKKISKQKVPEPIPEPQIGLDHEIINFKRIHLTLYDAKAKIEKLLQQIQSQKVKNSKTKRKRLYHQLAQLRKAVNNPDQFLIDPFQQKRRRDQDKARRIEKKIQLAEEKKKKEKNEERHKKRCLNCGSKDHILGQCAKVESGFCYKCGSTDHTHTQCDKEKFKFASCFVCNEKGHISRECPQNQKGLYRKGGSCFGCGSVRHTLKDCPKRHSSTKFVDQKEQF